MRVTCLAPTTVGQVVAALELRRRQRTRAKDRIYLRSRHRPAQPPTPRHRAGPDLARDHPDRPGPASHSPESRLTCTFPSLRTATLNRSRGTRRPPDATAGPSACPPSDRTRNGVPTPSADRHERSRQVVLTPGTPRMKPRSCSAISEEYVMCAWSAHGVRKDRPRTDLGRQPLASILHNGHASRTGEASCNIAPGVQPFL